MTAQQIEIVLIDRSQKSSGVATPLPNALPPNFFGPMEKWLTQDKPKQQQDQQSAQPQADNKTVREALADAFKHVDSMRPTVSSQPIDFSRTAGQSVDELTQATVELVQDTEALLKEAAEIAKQTGLTIDQARKLIEEGRVTEVDGKPYTPAWKPPSQRMPTNDDKPTGDGSSTKL